MTFPKPPAGSAESMGLAGHCAPEGKPQTFIFMPVEGMSMLSLASAIEPLRSANRLTGRELYRWRAGSLHGQVMRASNGIPLMPEVLEDILDDADVLLVVGGARADMPNERGYHSVLRNAARSRIVLGALSTGTKILADAGLLDGYRCTIHWENIPAFREDFPEIECTDKLFEIDRDRITCGGGAAAFDLMLHLISERHGPELTRAIANQFHHDRIRQSQDEQRGGARSALDHAPASLRKAITLMTEHLEDTLSIAQIAASVGLSVRQLERLYTRHLGVGPARHYVELRLEKARDLLLYSDRSVTEIAVAVGFTSTSHFAHWFRKTFGIRPSGLRSPGAQNRTVLVSPGSRKAAANERSGDSSSAGQSSSEIGGDRGADRAGADDRRRIKRRRIGRALDHGAA